MNGMLLPMPMVNSYFAIYTLEGPSEVQGRMARGLNWDLHATATDKTMAISHARMLALQPGVQEVHVKHVTEHLNSGLVSVRDVKRCRRGAVAEFFREFRMPAVAITLGVIAILAVVL